VERYMYRAPDWNGEFRHVAAGWEEYQNLVRKFTFIEESRAFDSITLLDSTRNIRVLLPIGGGQVFFRLGPATTWTPLANTSVDRIERAFTRAQLEILRQDCEQARQRLNRVNTRLGEAVITPTPVNADMRRKVRNIFHIDMDATLPDILTETIHFETLVINFRVLRSTGFTHDPPFVFEPDYTGTLVAWVVGIDDPRVHISPNHFYMDRESLILTLVHERAHTVLKLNGHPGGIHVVNNPANGVPTMGRDDALKNAYCYEWLTAALQLTT
jgi:alpha-ketoglutarate-dependent taurine dioxygenase